MADVTDPREMRSHRSYYHVWTLTAIALVGLLLAGKVALGWGRLGHRVSARLAEARLTPNARAAISNLLGGQSLVDVADWADEQRQIPGSGPWHYVDVPITEPRYDPKYCPPGGCVVSKIEEFRRVLIDPRAGKAEKQQALMFLVHFLQDLHQPLHIGDNGDHGGTRLQVRFFNVGSNLHRVWDSQIIQWHSRDEEQCFRELGALATPANVTTWSRGTVEDWATESLADARLAYRLPGSDELIKPGTRLGEEYCRFTLPIIQRRLAQAGVRSHVRRT